jgi:ferritin-like metal-binding protein YciE
MKAEIFPITTLHDLIDYDARKLFSAEKQTESTLPDWINKSGSLVLKNVMQSYLDLVKDNLKYLRTFIAEEKIDWLSCTNNVLQAFILETRERTTNCTDIEVLDACYISGLQGINHYKIKMYGTAAAYARALGNEKYAAVFHQAMINEKQIDDRLSQLAEEDINRAAVAPIFLPDGN